MPCLLPVSLICHTHTHAAAGIADSTKVVETVVVGAAGVIPTETILSQQRSMLPLYMYILLKIMGNLMDL